MKTDRKNKMVWRLLTAGLLAAAVFLAARGAAVPVEAGTGGSGTKVIRTSSEDEFAQETAKLAKMSRGLAIQSNGEVRKYSSGRLIVRVRDGESVDFSRYNASTVIQSSFGVSIVQFASETSAKKAAKSLAALSSVVYVDADDCTLNTGDTRIKEISIDGGSPSEQEIPSGGGIGEAGSLEIGGRTYGADEDVLFESSIRTNATAISTAGMSWGVSYIQADKYAAFARANTSQTIKVAVVDSGVSSHTKMKGRILKGKDFVDNDNNPADKNGHGTHVAGTVVDCTPGLNVKILPVRVMNASGIGNPSNVGNGIRYAVNQGAKVINLSLGGYSHYKYIEECLTYAQSKNVTVVVAAGNECDNTKFICPAHMSSPIVVGAINRNGKRAFFSNYGTSLDIVAPGVDIKSCWTGGKYATASGTSMAAPHISAAAAMYRLMNPSASASRVQYLVRCYAKDLGQKGTDNYYGRGVPRMAGAITPSKVTLNKTSTSLQLKKTLTLKAAITPSYAGKNKLTWSSSNSGIVSVSGGKLTAKKRGTATITVKTVNGKKATCRVTVTNPTVSTSAAQNKAPQEQDRIASAFLSWTKEPVMASHSGKTEKDASGQSAPAAARSGGSSGTAEKKDLTVSAAQVSVEDTVSTPAGAAAAESTGAGTAGSSEERTAVEAAEAVKIYIYPSDAPGSAPVQDGSIIAGSRLLLEAEIVPAMPEAADLVWTSSDPSVAEIDAEGVVTALAQGQTTITAVLPAAPGSSGEGAVQETGSAGSTADGAGQAAAVAGTGSFTLHVAAPSVLTRHASYDAGSAEKQQIQVVTRLPGTVDNSSETSAYVLALLCKGKDTEDAALLGAVDLGGADSGSIHLHDAKSGTLRKGIRTPEEAAGQDARTTDPAFVSEQILSPDRSGGKTAGQAGILSVEKMNTDGGKAELTLTADLDLLRLSASAADNSGQHEKKAARDCSLAVFTLEAFEEREKAAADADMETVRAMDAEALCSCRFTLAFAYAESAADPEKTGDAAETEDGNTPAESAETQDRQDSAAPGRENGGDSDENGSEQAQNGHAAAAEEAQADAQTSDSSEEMEEDSADASYDLPASARTVEEDPAAADGADSDSGSAVNSDAAKEADGDAAKAAAAGQDENPMTGKDRENDRDKDLEKEGGAGETGEDADAGMTDPGETQEKAPQG